MNDEKCREGLKQCPFCGGIAYLNENVVRIHCPSCGKGIGASVEVRRKLGEDDMEECITKATKSWNLRSEPSKETKALTVEEGVSDMQSETIKNLQERVKELDDNESALVKEIDRYEAEIATLTQQRDKLRGYSNHNDDCPANNYFAKGTDYFSDECTCGYSALIQEIRGKV
jgi:hypothetical protein